jgi:SSS family solute:Na+ symporter
VADELERWTDALQMVVMVVTASFAVLLVVDDLGGFGELFARVSEEHPGWLSVPGGGYFTFSVFVGLTLPWFFFSLSNPQVSQRLFMLGTMRNLRRMLLGFLVLGFVYTLVAVVWGFAALVRFPDLESADLASPSLLASDLVPPVVALIIIVGILAAAIITIDSILLTLSSMVARDVYGTRTGVDDSRQLTVGKIVIAVLALPFAGLQLDLIVVLTVSSSAGLLVTVPAIVGAFFWRRGTAAGVLSSVVVGGFLVALLEVSQSRPLGQASGVWGLLASAILYVGVSLLTRAPEQRPRSSWAIYATPSGTRGLRERFATCDGASGLTASARW